MPFRILILENDPAICLDLTQLFTNNQYQSVTVGAAQKVKKMLKDRAFDVLLCDCLTIGINNLDFLKKIQSAFPGMPVIFMSAGEGINNAVELLNNGAHDYIVKPVNPEKLLLAVTKALQIKGSTKSFHVADTVHKALPEKKIYISGTGELAAKLQKEIALVAPTDYNIIIQGETGTGKESVAHLIHNASNRNLGPFIPVDCGCLSSELALSELFGHEKGAFTGATDSTSGAFENASGGTLFLDEIANLSFNVQAYLLRAVQERSIRKVGGTNERPIDVRIVVASNTHLNNAVNEGTFREDLYHRLNEFTLKVPSLCDRKNDLELFIETFICQNATRLNKNIKGFTTDAMNILLAYHWPGNIRELENTIKRACLLTLKPFMCVWTLPKEIRYGYVKPTSALPSYIMNRPIIMERELIPS
ncbi:MAG TPA: sigma-54 dependent transcriptional regulator [Arachidicoccus sp.]|nr:sigma-54 dependent transcriptional regulator [Arachidicoccus sp.]